MSIRTILVEHDLLSKRTLKLYLESVLCEVYVLSDANVLLELLETSSFEVIIVSTLGSNRDPLLAAEQSKRVQPAARVLSWGPVIQAMLRSMHDYIDGQFTMPCTLAQLKAAVLPRPT
jgi:DNA-binding response OmpR family regulator